MYFFPFHIRKHRWNSNRWCILTTKKVSLFSGYYYKHATAEMALQRAHRPLGFIACQTTSQRLKKTTVELVKPAEMHSNNASQRSDDHWDANNFFSKKSCISAVDPTAEMQDNFIFYNILHLNGRADRWDAHIWLKKTCELATLHIRKFKNKC